MHVFHVLGKSLGGIRQHVASLHLELTLRGVESSIAGPYDVMHGLAPQETSFGVPSMKKPWTIFIAAHDVRKATTHANVIHAHGITAAKIALLSQRGSRHKKPIVVTMHNIVDPTVAGKKYRLMRYFERRILNRVNYIICPSAYALNHLVGITKKDLNSSVVLPVGRSLSETARNLASEQAPSMRQSFGIDEDVPLVACVARYEKQKDLPTLVDAFVEVLKALPRARLFIAGTGSDSDRVSIQRYIDSRRVNHAVSLIGYVNQPDVLIASAQLMVLSSIYETVPLVLLESLQLGTPVVMTDVGIASEILNGENGQFVPVGDSAALAQAIQTWCERASSNTIDVHSLRDSADTFVDRDACVNPIIQIYESLAHNKKAITQ